MNVSDAVRNLAAPIQGPESRDGADKLVNTMRWIANERHAPLGALKKMLPVELGAAKDEATAIERVKSELATLELVEHPALVKVLDSNID